MFALGASLGVAACATIPPEVLVNLAQPLPPPEDVPGARLDAGDDLSGRMTAPVRINGQGPFDFVVDTGANRTVIAIELAQTLKLAAGPSADVHGIAGVEAAQTVRIDTLDIDAVRSRGIVAPTLSRGRLGAAGLLGIDVLKNRRVLMDFRNNEFRIAPARVAERSGFDIRRGEAASRRPLGNGVAVPARYRFGQLIIVGADVAGRPVTAFLDSGAQTTVGNLPLRRLVLGEPPDPRLVRYVTSILSATGQTAEGEVGVMRLLKIGGLRVAGMQTVFAPLHVFDIWDLADTPSLLLAMDVMSRFEAIELDYARRLVTFYTPPAGRG